MSNPWFRMYAEFAHDPKVQMMDEAMQRRYMMLMCMRCSNALVTLHETEIAFHLRIEADEMAKTKALFITKGFIDSDWNLLNWEKRQFVSDTSNARVNKHRTLQKEKQTLEGNATVTLQKQKSNVLDTDTDTDTDTEKKGRASRIPTNFEPTPEPEAESGIDRQKELANFRDYWAAKAGKDAAKLDWQATWRQWVRKADRPGVSRFAKPAPNMTVPSRTERDPELTRLEIERSRAVPIPAAIREQMQKLRIAA